MFIKKQTTPIRTIPTTEKLNHGFTLIELMVVVAIGAILIVAAGPSYTTFMRSQRLSGLTNDYTVALRQARSEAIKGNATVRLCPPNGARDACAANSGNLLDGWLIVRTIGVQNTILGDVQPQTQGLTALPADTEISFSRLGRATVTSSSGSAPLTFCATGTTRGKRLSINASGQAKESDVGC